MTTQSTPSKLTTPLANYSHGRWVGNLLFIAGQGCRDPETGVERGLLPPKDPSHSHATYDITEQTWGVFANLDRVLHSHGLDKTHLVDITVFLTHMQDFQAMNAVWNEYFKKTPPPCRTTVAVAQLPGKNYIEMKGIAARP